MDWDFSDWEFVTGLISGGFLWQGIKSLASIAFKRWSEKKAGQARLLLADVEHLAKMVDPLFRLATTYYGASSTAGAQTARSIRMDMRTFAMQWTTVNDQLMKLGKPSISTGLLVAFRKALTGSLDVERVEPLSLETPEVSEMFTATQAVRDALSKLRYNLLD